MHFDKAQDEGALILFLYEGVSRQSNPFKNK